MVLNHFVSSDSLTNRMQYGKVEMSENDAINNMTVRGGIYESYVGNVHGKNVPTRAIYLKLQCRVFIFLLTQVEWT